MQPPNENPKRESKLRAAIAHTRVQEMSMAFVHREYERNMSPAYGSY